MPAVGFDTFFPKVVNTVFIVKNMTKGTKQEKTIRIFSYPIPPGKERDLLAIPYVSEADIRHSLLKGELMVKGRNGEYKVVESNIDLLQFDPEQKAFLESLWITQGITPGTGGTTYNWRENVELIGTKDGVNRIFTTPEKFLNGVVGNDEFHINVRHNGRVLVETKDYILSESGGAGSGYDTVIFINLSPTTTSQLYVNYVVAAPAGP